MSKPLVSIIVLCYNHAAFVQEAIRSAFEQDYESIEVFVVDDASTDESVKKIREMEKDFPFSFIRHDKNTGNCRAFNEALRLSKGEYVIDLAADDELQSGRVKLGVEIMEELPEHYGVHFCDARLVNSKDEILGTQYERNEKGHLIELVPHGDVFAELLSRYFICPTTMLIKSEVLSSLGGYDENLTYEDFDFWVRSSRNFYYAFTDKVLVKKRILKKSLSSQQKRPGNKHVLSTAIVCEKAFELCVKKEEYLALRKRIYYEMKWATLTGNFKAIQKYIVLLKKIVGRVKVVKA